MLDQNSPDPLGSRSNTSAAGTAQEKAFRLHAGLHFSPVVEGVEEDDQYSTTHAANSIQL